MVEIRSIADGEGAAVAALWDEMCRATPGSGLLPGLLGELETLYTSPCARGQGTSRALAQAAIRELQARGARVLHRLICVDDQAAQELWSTLGFERDMVCMSMYPES